MNIFCFILICTTQLAPAIGISAPITVGISSPSPPVVASAASPILKQRSETAPPDPVKRNNPNNPICLKPLTILKFQSFKTW